MFKPHFFPISTSYNKNLAQNTRYRLFTCVFVVLISVAFLSPFSTIYTLNLVQRLPKLYQSTHYSLVNIILVSFYLHTPVYFSDTRSCAIGITILLSKMAAYTYFYNPLPFMPFLPIIDYNTSLLYCRYVPVLDTLRLAPLLTD